MRKIKQPVFTVVLLMLISLILSCGGDDKKINIIGTVTLNNAGLAGVKVTLDGVETQMTALDGGYTFSHVISGTHTIVPTLDGYVFTPTSLTVTVNEKTVFDQNFTATLLAGTAKAVAGGYQHTTALKSDGTVWSWGANNYGQLGDETTTDSIITTKIESALGSYGNFFKFNFIT